MQGHDYLNALKQGPATCLGWELGTRGRTPALGEGLGAGGGSRAINLLGLCGSL